MCLIIYIVYFIFYYLLFIIYYLFIFLLFIIYYLLFIIPTCQSGYPTTPAAAEASFPACFFSSKLSASSSTNQPLAAIHCHGTINYWIPIHQSSITNQSLITIINYHKLLITSCSPHPLFYMYCSCVVGSIRLSSLASHPHSPLLKKGNPSPKTFEY